MSKQDTIIVVLEGGLVQGVYTRTGSSQNVVVIDYDGDEMDDNPFAVAVPQPDGGATNAWVFAHCPYKADPVIADFADQFVGETYE